MVETDMIPFFQFASDCIVFKTFAIWDETPPQEIIDQGPNGPGTWNLAQPIGQQDGNLLVNDSFGFPTWDNFYLAGDGSGCISYVNKDIQIPYVAMASDIDFSDSSFTYMNSITISKPKTNITKISSSVINGNSVLRLTN